MEVQEKWWHRLVKIGLIVGCSLFTLVAVGGSATAWQKSRTYHSFEEAHWDASDPGSLCRVTLYSEELGASVNCGDYYKPIDLFEALLAAKRVGDSQEFRQSSEYQQGRSIEAYLSKQPQHYRYGREIAMEKVLLATGIAFGLSAALWLLAFGFWRALLYVAHGPKARLIR